MSVTTMARSIDAHELVQLTMSLVLIAAGCSGTAASNPGTTDAPAHGATDGPTSSGGRLFPLAVGYHWTYSASGGCTGTIERTVTTTGPVDGRTAFHLQVAGCANTVDQSLSMPGSEEIDVDVQGSWLVLVDPTLAEGHSWTYYTTTLTWHRETSVSVPAGTFTDCWTSMPDTQSFPTNTYCRGVGLVRSAGPTDQVLTAKSF